VETKDWRKFRAVTVRWYGKPDRVYSTLADAVAAVGWYTINECTRGFVGYSYCSLLGRPWFWGDPVEFLDEMNLRIPLWRVREEAMRLGLHKPRKRWSRYGRFVFRSGPVEGIRCYRGGCGYRNMRTHQEICANDFLDECDEEAAEHHIRARARRKSLPNYWDDIAPTRYPHKNWKRYRRHQWW
jgi:hypothetical protein